MKKLNLVLLSVEGWEGLYVNGELCKSGRVYVDPSGVVETDDQVWYGNGPR